MQNDGIIWYSDNGMWDNHGKLMEERNDNGMIMGQLDLGGTRPRWHLSSTSACTAFLESNWGHLFDGKLGIEPSNRTNMDEYAWLIVVYHGESMYCYFSILRNFTIFDARLMIRAGLNASP